MFLSTLMQRNPALIEYALSAHARGELMPDTYVLDLDAILENAAAIKSQADRYGIKLYYMLKQLGRNPLIAKRLTQAGWAGAVAVDWKEALTILNGGGKLGNVGHLVQTPKNALIPILEGKPDIMTVYSVQKAAEIDAACGQLGMQQSLMLRARDEKDHLYSGQECGVSLSELERTVEQIRALRRVRIAGVCSFPCFLYDDSTGKLEATENAHTVCRAAAMLREMGCEIEQVNMPSASCCETVPKAAALGATHMEPGHALSGTTPWHVDNMQAPERPAYVYLSEVSHNFGSDALCYGGGHYRRSHLANALVGGNLESAIMTAVVPPTDESIDYHFTLKGNFPVSTPVVMCFRTQIFVTRSDVAVVEGLSKGAPKLVGIFSALGTRLR